MLLKSDKKAELPKLSICAILLMFACSSITGNKLIRIFCPSLWPKGICLTPTLIRFDTKLCRKAINNFSKGILKYEPAFPIATGYAKFISTL